MGQKKSSKVFSVRVDEKSLDKWQRYAEVSGIKISSMVEKAMDAYIDSHPLTGFKANIFNTLIGGNRMTVREWIEETACKAIEREENTCGRYFSESDKQVYINDLVNECVDGWDAGDDPNADDEETRFMRDRIEEYCEEQAEAIIEEMAECEDEAF